MLFILNAQSLYNMPYHQLSLVSVQPLVNLWQPRRPSFIFGLQDVFYSGSIYNLQEFKDVSNMQNYVASIVSIPAIQEKGQRKVNIFPCCCLPEQMTDVFNGEDIINV